MKKNDEGFNIVSFFRKLVTKNTPVAKDDIGIYHYVWNTNTYTVSGSVNNDTRAVNCDVWVKVKAVEVFQNLVEISIISTETGNCFNRDITTLIGNTIPKYINPNYVKWQIK